MPSMREFVEDLNARIGAEWLTTASTPDHLLRHAEQVLADEDRRNGCGGGPVGYRRHCVAQSLHVREAEYNQSATAFSVTDSAEASRGNARELLNGDTSYVTVKVNGKSRVVPGANFTDVKSVLDAGDITLEPEDTISPRSLPRSMRKP